MRRLDGAFVVIAIVAVGLAGAIAISLVFWRESEAVRNFAILASLAIAVPIGVWRIVLTARQAGAAERSAEAGASAAEISRREALDNQLRTGAEMIAGSTGAVRAAGAFLLERLAADHPLEYDQVVSEVLAAARDATANGNGEDADNADS